MKYLLLIFIVLAITSCRTLAPPQHTVINDPYLQEKCFPATPEKTFRAVHVINATIRGKSSSFIGVTIADASMDRIRATLLSVEGLVLLDATDNKGNVTIYRAMQPFTSESFASGLFNDIRFIFFSSHGDLTSAKVKADGSVTCRWIDYNRVFEKDSGPSGETIIREYGSTNRIMRQVTLSPPIIKGFYTHIRMDSYGEGGYSLSLELLEGEPLDRVDGLFEP